MREKYFALLKEEFEADLATTKARLLKDKYSSGLTREDQALISKLQSEHNRKMDALIEECLKS